jgi:ABC-2 type transport system permease protein
MNTATINPTHRPTTTPGGFEPVDLSAIPRIPLSRLTKVELRKLANTRSGKWLLIGIGVLTLVVVVGYFITAQQSDRTFFNFMAAANGPQGILLPVLGILLVTSEWTQRTALVSFTLMPVRGRILVAKTLAALIAGLAAIAVAVALACVATAAGGAPDAWAGLGVDDAGKFVLLQATGVLQGLAFGLLLLNSSAAIVSYFVLPTALSIVAMMWKSLQEVQPWIDLWSSQSPLFMGGDISNDQWGQITTSTLIWVVLPLAAGLFRVLRAEVK